MQSGPTTSSTTSRLRSRRAARLALLALALCAAGLAVAQSANRRSRSADEQAHRPSRDRDRSPRSNTGRRSGGLQGLPEPSGTTSSPVSLPPPSPWPGSASPRSTDGTNPGLRPDPVAPQGSSPFPAPRGPDSGPGGSGSFGGNSPATNGPAATAARPFAIPGTGSTGVPSPTAPTDPNSRPAEIASATTPIPIGPTVPVVTTSTTTTTTPPPEPEPEPDLDEVNCPNLDLTAIGVVSIDAPAILQSLAPRFRALAAPELAKPLLVCAKPLEFWRDLVIQRLVTAGQADGALITATDGSSVVLRISEIDWTGYRLRFGGSPIGVNFLGYPVGYETIGETTVLRTTLGGLVSARPDTIGIPVVGGAWDFWMAHGGPAGPMGTVTGLPQAAYGPSGDATPAERTDPRVPASGASQDFVNGWIFLPGVASDIEAAAQPADRYQWHDQAEYLATPTDGLGHILQTDRMSYYVDPGGVRHWLPTTSAWSCARWNLGATEIAVRGFTMADYALGSQFVCPS